MHRRNLVAAALVAGAFCVPAWAQSDVIQVAHIYSKTGPLDAYGTPTQIGRMMGLDSSCVIFSIVMVSSPLSSSRMSCSLKPSVASSSMRCEDSDFLSRS